MAIHAISLIRNEADIIEDNLSSASRWADHIYVMDNGSTDGTWELVQELAKGIPNIVPYKQDPRPFADSLRDEVYQHFKKRSRRGDWWAVLDADEFYIDDPVEFLSQVPEVYRTVWPQLYTYLVTHEDLDKADESRPRANLERLRHFKLVAYTEVRFARDDGQLHVFPPYDPHPVYPRRIRMRHYPYRSADQIAQRIETRREAMRHGEFVHEKRNNWPQGCDIKGPAAEAELPESWEERIVSGADYLVDTGPDSLPPPLHWGHDDLYGDGVQPRLGLASRMRHIARRLAASR